MICTRCVMDQSDPDIKFDEQGVCNHCHAYDKFMNKHEVKGFSPTKELIKEGCVLGVSGGIDSTYVAYLLHMNKVPTTLVHFDNGYDTPESRHNIEMISKHTDTQVWILSMNLDEFHDLQRSYMAADVVDIEVPTDMAITAAVYNTAKTLDIKWIMGGSNMWTEATMPKTWGYEKLDVKNLEGIHKRFGTMPLETFPKFSIWDLAKMKMKGFKTIFPLNYVHYDRFQAFWTLRDEWNFKHYGLKHYESVFTRFYQGFILPNKFGVDKRKAHFSDLVRSHQMTRVSALYNLDEHPYGDIVHRQHSPLEDLITVCEILGISQDDYLDYLDRPRIPHRKYGTDKWMRTALYTAQHLLKWVKAV